MTKIKICGLTRRQDIEAANSYLPDYIGFVFAKSKRQLSLKEAKYLKSMLNPAVKAVGVFVNEPIENLLSYEKENVIDIIQLHGDEDTDYISRLKAHVTLPIIKAVRVKEDVKLSENKDISFYLLDKYSDKAYGGCGECFNWGILKNIKVPYFLAGGIHLGNVEEALKQTPYAIDVSSGVETDGVKDIEKMRQIITLTRTYEINFSKNKMTR